MDYISNLILKCSQRIYFSIKLFRRSDGIALLSGGQWAVDLNILLSSSFCSGSGVDLVYCLEIKWKVCASLQAYINTEIRRHSLVFEGIQDLGLDRPEDGEAGFNFHLHLHCFWPVCLGFIT